MGMELDVSWINLILMEVIVIILDLPSRRCCVQITAITDSREPRVCDCVHDINKNVLEASIDKAEVSSVHQNGMIFSCILGLYDNNESISTINYLSTILMDTTRMNMV